MNEMEVQTQNTFRKNSEAAISFFLPLIRNIKRDPLQNA